MLLPNQLYPPQPQYLTGQNSLNIQPQQYYPQQVEARILAQRNERLNAPLDQLLQQPMKPYDFCVRWLPIKYSLEWGDSYARESACEMLSILSNHKKNTWSYYLSEPEKVTIITRRLIKGIDIFWQLQNLIRPLPTDECLLQPLNPEKFCTRWLPFKYGIEWGDRFAREFSCQLLSYHTNHRISTWNSWLTNTEKSPIVVRRYLKLLDFYWDLKYKIPLPLSQLKL